MRDVKQRETSSRERPLSLSLRASQAPLPFVFQLPTCSPGCFVLSSVVILLFCPCPSQDSPSGFGLHAVEFFYSMYAVIKARVQIFCKKFEMNLDPCFYYSIHAVELIPCRFPLHSNFFCSLRTHMIYYVMSPSPFPTFIYK
jgi:hypothetical protein